MNNSRETVQRSMELAFMSGLVGTLIGVTGVGKSDMVAEIARNHGRKLVALNAAIQQPETLAGYPYRDGDVERWAKPEWFPSEENSTVLFIDEINRASKSVMNSLMMLLLTGELCTHKLPK